jgi:ABC-type sugar transport system, periplasmic component
MSFAACGQNGSGNNGTTVKTSDTESKQAESSTQAVNSDVTLKVMISTDWNSDAMKDVFERYQANGSKLDVQILPGGQKLDDLILTRAATKDLPDIIFVYGMSNFLTKVQASNNFVDLSGESYISKISKSISAQKDWLKMDGKYYAIPAGGLNVSGVIYNKKVFEDLKIEVPKTYDELLAACEKIKGAGITPIYEAGKDGWPLQLFTFNLFADMVQKKQADIIDRLNSNQVKFAEIPEYIKALEMQKSLKEKGYVNSDLMSGTYDASLAGLAEGKVGMIFNADWAIPTLVQKYPDAKIGMFAMPYDGDNVCIISDPWAVSISSYGKNIDAAKKFLEFFTSEENLNTYYGKLKSIPAYSGVKVDLNPGTAEMAEMVDEGKALPFYNGLLNPAYKDYIKVLQELYTGISPEEAAKKIDEQRASMGKELGMEGWK